MTSRIEATLIPGDGIGPEIVEAVEIVLDGLGSPFVWDVRRAGIAKTSKGCTLPSSTTFRLAMIRTPWRSLRA